jgi:CBS domain-containing protein
MTVARILEKKGYQVFTVAEDAPLRAVIKQLANHHIGVVVVTDASGQMVGLLSERDVIRELAKDVRATDRMASDVMTRTICKCAPDETESDIMERMGKAGVRHLPVEHSGKLVGVISARDVLNLRIEKLNALMKEIREEAARLA